MTILQRHLPLLLAAATPAACDLTYPCALRCQEASQTIAMFGYNEDAPGGSGELDPSRVCDAEAIREARGCAECEAAITDTYRLWTQNIACDCPQDSVAVEDPEDYRVRFADTRCQTQDLPFSPASCAIRAREEHPNPRLCTN